METHSSIPAWRIPMDRGAWQATDHGVSELDTTERLSIAQHIHITIYKIKKSYPIAPLVVQTVKQLPAMWETGFNPWVRKIPWRRKWQPTPVRLPGKIPWLEEPGGLQSMGS